MKLAQERNGLLESETANDFLRPAGIWRVASNAAEHQIREAHCKDS